MCHEGQALVFQSAALTAELPPAWRGEPPIFEIQRLGTVSHHLLNYFFKLRAEHIHTPVGVQVATEQKSSVF
jgi:hypothetical protein